MKRQWMWVGLLLVMGLALLALGLGPAQAGDSGAIEWVVLDGGGGHAATAGGVTIDASLGQPVAGETSAEGTALCAGFWCTLQQNLERLMLPLILKD